MFENLAMLRQGRARQRCYGGGGIHFLQLGRITRSHKTTESRLCERSTNSSFFVEEITSAAQQPQFFTISAQLTHLTKVCCSDLFTMIATNKIYLGGVEHFAWLSHNLPTMVLCDPVQVYFALRAKLD